MANEPNSAFVSTGKPSVTGGALIAPLGTTLATDATTALAVTYVGIGYIGDGGVTRTEARTSDKKKAWGGTVVYSAQTDYEVSYKLTLIEHYNPKTQQIVHGTANVVVTPATTTKGTGIAVKGNAKTLEHQVWAFEMPDALAKTRHLIPDGQITELGDVVYVDSDLIAYEVTITCYPDALGNSYYEYLDDGIKTA